MPRLVFDVPFVIVISEAVIVIALQLELFDHDHGRDHEREPGVMISKGAG